MRISDWSSDVCSSDLTILIVAQPARRIFIGNKLAVIVDYRISPDVKKRTSLTDLDIFVADTAKQCDIRGNREIGRASRRERVCKYVLISVYAVSLEKKQDA